VDSNNIYFVSLIKDLVWAISNNGKVNGYYDLLGFQNMNNISYLNDVFFVVSSRIMSKLKVS